jgi:hypothetical protein
LTILSREPMHGYGISQRLAVLSRDQFRGNPGSLFPSLYKLKAEERATDVRAQRAIGPFTGNASPVRMWRADRVRAQVGHNHLRLDLEGRK